MRVRWLSRLIFCFCLLLMGDAYAQHCPAERTCGATCCPSGQLCYQGACTTPTKSCTKASDCGTGTFCAMAFGKCLAQIKTNATCTYRPPIGTFSPTTLWEWKGSTVLPTYKQVMMTPMVMALQDSNKDGTIDVKDIPSVIFISHVGGGSHSEEGVLRALRGDNGKEIFTVTDSRYRLNGLGSLAVGDIDNDGKPDIVASRFAGKNVWNAGLHAFDSTGKYKWTTRYSNGTIANLPVSWGGPSLADLDGDGNVEVILGKAVIRGKDGVVICEGAGSKGNGSPNQRMPLSVVADLDGDGKQEIITGNAAYRHDCKLMWSNTEVDGYVAVADLNNDGKPEMAVVTGGTIRIQDALTGKVLMRVTVPGGGQGPPTIGDFNGDGKPDVAMAGSKRYVVYSPNFTSNTMTLLWSYVTQDYSSGRTGSSIFDFEGDKKAEAVYNDERFARVFNGTTGQVLFSSPNNSSTAVEYPVVVDVNNDGRAEIVISSNHGSMAHIRVLRDSLDNWVDTRNVWNQHMYSVTNICTGPTDPFCPPGSKFGQIPKKPLQNWKVAGLNNFRQNVQGKGLFQAADLVLQDMRASWLVGCNGKVEVGVWAYNKGAKTIPTGIPVTFYVGTVASKTKLTTLITNRALEPGEGIWLKTTLTIAKTQPQSLYVAVDDNGAGKSTRNECDEKNNGLAYQLPPVGGGEVCDGVDNDCNGQIDDIWPDKGKACSVGLGACKQSGTWRCKSDKSGIECSVQGGAPSPEVCDGKDNNCNGQIDENVVRKCSSACGSGQETCKSGKWQGCTAPTPKAETCNGQDDDCNGTVDDGIPASTCQTACGAGKQTCQNGALVCDARLPTKEVCNGQDDDCNGTVDDGIAPKSCSGACGTGTAVCQNGKWTGCSGQTPKPEVCNGKDDDCNGKPDDGLRKACKSACGNGFSFCQIGTWTECNAPLPQPELCNGKDDNCDGSVDETAKCPSGARCFEGKCQLKCRDGECRSGTTCVDGYCVGNPCSVIKCDAGRVCYGGVCVDPCSLVQCPKGEVCLPGKGRCYKEDCYSKGCPKGSFCQQGACVNNPCANKTCDAGSFCRPDENGGAECVSSCAGVTCGNHQLCVDGKCVDDPGKTGTCQGVSCPEGQRCVNGLCEADLCRGIDCGPRRVCRDGACVDDPCGGVLCPSGQRCVNGQCDGTPGQGEPTTEPVFTETPQTSEPVITETNGEVQQGAELTQPDSGQVIGKNQEPTGGDNDPAATGCGCQGAPTSFSWLALLFFGLVLRRRRHFHSPSQS